MTILGFETSPTKDTVLFETKTACTADSDAPAQLIQALNEPNVVLDELLDALSRVLSLLKAGTSSKVLYEASNSLRALHGPLFIWTLPAPTHPHLWSRFLHLYFSIPDRISAVLELSDSDSLSPRNFIVNLVQNEKMLQAKDERVLDLIRKSSNIGSVPVFVEYLVENKRFPTVLYCIENLSAGHLDTFVLELFGCLAVQNSDPLSLSRQVEKLFSSNILFSTLLCLIPDVPFDVFGCFLYYCDLDRIVVATKHLLELWAIRTDLLRTPLHIQRKITNLTLVALSFCSHDLLIRNQLENFILEGVQRRLDSSDEDLALMGKVLAECFATSTQTEKRLLFELDSTKVNDFRHSFEYGRIIDELLLEKLQLPCVRAEISWVLEKKPVEIIDDYELIESSVKGAPALTLENDIAPFMKITSSDEEPRNAKIKKPRFIRDCLAYIKCADDPAKLELGMSQLEMCLKDCSTILMEEIGADLFRSVLFQMDHYNIPNFEETRKSALCHLVQVAPHVMGPVIVEGITGRACSLRQKLEAVTSVMMAIRASGVDKKQEAKRSFVNARMNLLNAELGFSQVSEYETPRTHPTQIARNIVFPLLTAIPDAECKVFGPSNTLLLEKMIVLLALTSSHLNLMPEYPRFVKNSLSFIRPLLDSNKSLPRPILRMTILSLQCLLSGLSEAIAITDYIEDMYLIRKFFENNEQLAELDPDYITMAGCIVAFIEDRADPVKLLEAACSELSFERDLVVKYK